jgi:hypothetical protein
MRIVAICARILSSISVTLYLVTFCSRGRFPYLTSAWHVTIKKMRLPTQTPSPINIISNLFKISQPSTISSSTPWPPRSHSRDSFTPRPSIYSAYIASHIHISFSVLSAIVVFLAPFVHTLLVPLSHLLCEEVSLCTISFKKR